MIENFFKILKGEMIYGNKLISRQQMRAELLEFIKIWYNRERKYSVLKKLNIQEFWEVINKYIILNFMSTFSWLVCKLD